MRKATTENAITPEALSRDLPPDDAEIFCPQCGYSLQGIEAALRCPECGLEIDRQGFSRSRIPWVYRGHIGRVRAYSRTVWLATADPGRLAAEAAMPVSYRDAQRFRMVTSFLIAAPPALVLIGVMIWYESAGFFNLLSPGALASLMFAGGANRTPPWTLNVIIPWEAGATLAPVMPLALFVAAAMVTGVTSYWFHSSGLAVVLQNRAVALSHYAGAPLVFLSVPLGALLLMAVLQGLALDDPGRGFGPLITVCAIVATVGLVAVGGLFMRSTLVLLRRTTQAGFARVALAAIVLPMMWTLCAALALVVLPWVVGFLRLVITSLRG